MKTHRILALLLAAVLVFALAACGETPAVDDVYENGVLQLTVPAEYKDLVVVTTPSEGSELFNVAEKASVEAAQKQTPGEDWGAGWLFSISRVDVDEMHRLLCSDLNVDFFFAKDDDGYYLFSRPSDVRFVREDYSNIPEEDLTQWSALNEWAMTVPDSFVNKNPSVTAHMRSNTMLDQFLNRIAYEDALVYTLSSTEFGPLAPVGNAGNEALTKLLEEMTFEAADLCSIPDGEYYVLNFPDEAVQFRIYSGMANYVSYTFGESGDYCLIGSFAPDGASVHDVFGQWYDALAVAHGLK